MQDKIVDEFKNPSVKYRTAPFWSWNGALDSKELCRQMEDFKAHGIGGAFAHARQGLITEYLSDEFFDRFKDTLEFAKNNDMLLYMYDENEWPSGFANGKVAAIDNSVIGPIAVYDIVDAENPRIPGELYYAAEIDVSDGIETGNAKLGKILTDVAPEEWKNMGIKQVMIVYKHIPNVNSCGGYPYVDVTNPRTAELFLQTTYDEYYKRFGKDFGKYVPASFSDEANMVSRGRNSVPFSNSVEKKFRELNGYDIRPNLPAVFRNLHGDFEKSAEKIRYDFYYTLHECWIDNFVKPIAKWCDEHNIAWTGHDVEQGWPQAHADRIIPSEQTTYEFRQWPGLDLLLCEHLRNNPMNTDKHEMLEVRSAANQFGKERTLCEAYGAGGFDSTLADYKRLSDYLLVDGINFICQHLSLYSYAGCRKRDCPQSFDYRQPWWDEYTEFADYLARASYILSSGKMEQRILLMNPSTTGYLIPAEEAEGTIDHKTTLDCCKNPDMTDFLTLMQELCDGQWDFDLGDEYSFERHAHTSGNKLVFGEQTYSIVLISKNMRNMRKATAEVLIEFMKNGGLVIATGKDGVCEYIDGEKGRPETAKLFEKINVVSSPKEAVNKIGENIECYIASEKPWETGIQTMRRLLPDGKVCYFIVNHSMTEKFDTKITLKGESASKWELFDGTIHGLEVEKHNGYVTFPLSLYRCQSALIVTGDNAPVEKQAPEADARIALNNKSIVPETDNTFSVDHVELEVNGKMLPKRYVLHACTMLYQEKGLGRDIWQGAQIKTESLDKNALFVNDDGFKAHYKFNVADDFLPDRLTATIERPNLMRLMINGTEVVWDGTKDERIDPDTGVFDIARHVRHGENVLTVFADKFNTLCELEIIILRGSFAIHNVNNKFVMSAPESPKLGKWDTFGMPFYPYSMIYNYTATLDKVPEKAEIHIGAHDATAVSVRVNGTYAGVCGRDGGNMLNIAKYLNSGENEISLRVCGSFRNLYGPYLCNSDVMPYDWSLFKEKRPAEPDEYMLHDYGLYEEPYLMISK